MGSNFCEMIGVNKEVLIMDNNEILAKCGDCGEELKQSDKRCPKCGSKNRDLYSVDKGMGHEHIKLKQKTRDLKRPVKEINEGWKSSKDPKLDGLPVEEGRRIDRGQDMYDEVIKNSGTGEIMVEKHERLSEHKSSFEVKIMNQQLKDNKDTRQTAINHASLALGLLAIAFGICYPYFELLTVFKVAFWVSAGLAVFCVWSSIILTRYMKHPDLFSTTRKHRLVNSLSSARLGNVLWFVSFVGIGVALITIGRIEFVIVGVVAIVLGYILLIKGIIRDIRERGETSKGLTPKIK